jgi:aspartate-semialdehyde dehydrogenase
MKHMTMETKIPVGILGGTGMVGQHFVKFLQNHPWFEITWLGASDRSAGKPYREATSWRLDGAMPASVEAMQVDECKPGRAPRLVFSATDSSVATEIEQAFAQAGHVVVSNSRNHRMEADVPLVIPEINADHLKIIPLQQRRRGWKGQIATNPNCATMVIAMALAPFKPYGITKIMATTMQAVSGAGYPGVASMDIAGNVIPFIGSEEEKVESETQKILGDFTGDAIRSLPAKVTAQCNRVAVVDGHMACCSVSLERKPPIDELIHALENFRSVPQERKLPSAPPQPIIYMRDKDRPQPRRDANRDRGMTTFVGRLRECPVLGYKFVALSHNTIRGAAGAAVLNAELMYSEGLLD